MRLLVLSGLHGLNAILLVLRSGCLFPDQGNPPSFGAWATEQKLPLLQPRGVTPTAKWLPAPPPPARVWKAGRLPGI